MVLWTETRVVKICLTVGAWFKYLFMFHHKCQIDKTIFEYYIASYGYECESKGFNFHSSKTNKFTCS